MLGAPFDLPSWYFSLFLSNSLSVSLSLYLTEMKKWNELQIVDRSSEIADHSASTPVQRWLLLLPVVRPSLKVFLSDSFSDSQSFSLYLTEWKNEMKFMNQNESLSLYFNSLSNLNKSLSFLNCDSLIGWLLLFLFFFVFLNLALSYPFLLVNVLVLVKYWLSFSATCVVICDWHCEIFLLQLDIVIGAHVVLICCLLSGVGRG